MARGYTRWFFSPNTLFVLFRKYRNDKKINYTPATQMPVIAVQETRKIVFWYSKSFFRSVERFSFPAAAHRDVNGRRTWFSGEKAMRKCLLSEFPRRHTRLVPSVNHTIFPGHVDSFQRSSASHPTVHRNTFYYMLRREMISPSSYTFLHFVIIKI